MKQIYLDNAATTKPSKEVISAMAEASEKYWGNPSSIHSVGQEARKIVDEGRRFVSFFIGCEPDEVIFTSSGSESDNLAIRGIVEAVILSETKNLRRSFTIVQDDNYRKPHVITSQTEHHAVLHTIQELEKEGKIEATYLKPDRDGIVSADQVKKSIRANTILVSIIYVNNETGVVSPIREIGLMLERENFSRNSVILSSPSAIHSSSVILNDSEGSPKTELQGDSSAQPQNDKRRKDSSRDDRQRKRIYFHTDAVQAAEFFQIAPEYLKVDLLTLTAHKLHGPKGIGVLYVKKGTPIKALITGGSQEFRLRAGTENIAGIVGLHKALDLILRDRAESKNLLKYHDQPELMSSPVSDRLVALQKKLISGIKAKISSAILNGSKVHRSPHIVNFSFLNAEGEAIILNLDFLGIAVSSGSACTSRSLEPSHVLSAMGIPPEKAHGSIRFSFGRDTTEAEIDEVLKVLPGIINKLREMSPFKS